MSPSRPAVRPPRQQRSRESLERVLQAGVEVLAETGWEGFTVNEVARRAQVSIGSLYGRFASKEALFLAIQERILATIEADQERSFAAVPWDDLDAAATIDQAVREVAGVFERHHEVLQVVMLRGAVDLEVQRRGSASTRHLTEAFEALLMERSDAFRHPEPALAVDVCFRIVYDTLARRMTHGPGFESDIDLGWDRLVDELAAVCRAYLLAG